MPQIHRMAADSIQFQAYVGILGELAGWFSDNVRLILQVHLIGVLLDLQLLSSAEPVLQVV